MSDETLLIIFVVSGIIGVILLLPSRPKPAPQVAPPAPPLLRPIHHHEITVKIGSVTINALISAESSFPFRELEGRVAREIGQGHKLLGAGLSED